MIEKLKANQLLRHPNLVQVKELRVINENLFCGKVIQLQVIYDYYNFTLERLISERLRIGQAFSEKEIVDFLFQLMEALIYL